MIIKRFPLGMAVALCAIAAIGMCPSARAQPAPAMHTLQLSDPQIEGLLQAGVACSEKVPLACSRLVIYLNDLLTEARKPKPPAEPKKDP